MNENKNIAKKEEITIKSLAEIFIPKIWIIALVSIVLSAALGVYSQFLQSDKYTASGKYMVLKVPYTNSTSETSGLNSGEILAMQGMIANIREIINTNNFCQDVINQLENEEVYGDKYEGKLTAARLTSMTSVTLANAETTCYYFDVTTSDPQLSKDIATVGGNILLDKFEGMGYAIKVVEIDTPILPSSPDGKNVLRNSVIGFAAGLVISMLAIYIISRADIVVHSKEKLEDSFDIPILGVIPKPETDE